MRRRHAPDPHDYDSTDDYRDAVERYYGNEDKWKDDPYDEKWEREKEE